MTMPRGGEEIDVGAGGGGLQPVDLRRAARFSRETLSPLAREDWSAPAHGLRWSRRYTLEHTAMVIDYYGLDLAAGSAKPVNLPEWPKAESLYPHASIEQLLVLLEVRAVVLADLATLAPATRRGYHPWGPADPIGYVGMGCVEILVHTDDVARGFGRPREPAADLCRRIVDRMFPWAPTDVPPWEALRWATGRAALPQSERLSKWRWHAGPLDEWDGQPRIG